MGINVIDPAGTDRSITGINVVDPAGTDRALVQINVIGPDGADRVVWTSGGGSSSLAVSASPMTVSGVGRSSTVITDATNATPSGGTPPYTHSWSVLDYDNDTLPPRIAQPTSPTTTFTQRYVPRGGNSSATFRDTVTDSATPTPATAHVDVNAFWTYLT